MKKNINMILMLFVIILLIGCTPKVDNTYYLKMKWENEGGVDSMQTLALGTDKKNYAYAANAFCIPSASVEAILLDEKGEVITDKTIEFSFSENPKNKFENDYESNNRCYVTFEEGGIGTATAICPTLEEPVSATLEFKVFPSGGIAEHEYYRDWGVSPYFDFKTGLNGEEGDIQAEGNTILAPFGYYKLPIDQTSYEEFANVLDISQFDYSATGAFWGEDVVLPSPIVYDYIYCIKTKNGGFAKLNFTGAGTSSHNGCKFHFYYEYSETGIFEN